MSLYTTLNRLFSKVSTSLNGIKTGWDGTQYETAGEAVRQQISDIHVLIGDAEGEAISASAVGYDGTESGLSATNVKEAIDEIVEQNSGSGLSDDVKTALLNVVSHIGTWTDQRGRTYYQELYDALYAITAVDLDTNSLSFTSLGATQELTATTTPEGGNITWSSSDETVATVENGIVTSTGYGSATITATAGNISTTCSVIVAEATVISINATYNQTKTVYDTDRLNVLTSDLVVTASWSNGTVSTVNSADYTLSGTMTTGTSVITVSYGGRSTTFNVTVSVRTLLYHWDFTGSDPMVDKVSSKLATAHGTLDYTSDGVSFGTNASYVQLGLTWSNIAGHEVEIEFADMVSTGSVSAHQRLFTIANQTGFILRKDNQKWNVYGGSSSGWQTSTLSRNDIANKTIRIVFNSASDIDVYADGVLILENASVQASSTSQINLGASSNSSIITRVKSLKIFD